MVDIPLFFSTLHGLPCPTWWPGFWWACLLMKTLTQVLSCWLRCYLLVHWLELNQYWLPEIIWRKPSTQMWTPRAQSYLHETGPFILQHFVVWNSAPSKEVGLWELFLQVGAIFATLNWLLTLRYHMAAGSGKNLPSTCFMPWKPLPPATLMPMLSCLALSSHMPWAKYCQTTRLNARSQIVGKLQKRHSHETISH